MPGAVYSCRQYGLSDSESLDMNCEHAEAGIIAAYWGSCMAAGLQEVSLQIVPCEQVHQRFALFHLLSDHLQALSGSHIHKFAGTCT